MTELDPRDDRPPRAVVVPTGPEHFDAIEQLSRRVYPGEYPWTGRHLSLQTARFPEGQRVALDPESGAVVGMSASLLLSPAQERADAPYETVTGGYEFDNHDPRGTTLYGAEVMVDPHRRRRGVGAALYRARRELVARVGARRIRAAARLAGYAEHAGRLSPEAYVAAVVAERLRDPTLTFQLHEGFRVVERLPGYFAARDRESGGEAVLIEWAPTNA